MVSRDSLLHELQSLAADLGPDITLFKFHQATGIDSHHVYRKWGNWTTLRLAAGLPPRAKVPKVYSDDHLFERLTFAGDRAEEFPTGSAFGRFAGHCWSTLAHRFGKRLDIWRRYIHWLKKRDFNERPCYLKVMSLDDDPAAIPGVTGHQSREDRQRAIDDYNEQRLYLHESLLGPPPPGWTPGPPDINPANWTFDVGPGAPGHLRRPPSISPASTLHNAAECDVHAQPISEPAAPAPGVFPRTPNPNPPARPPSATADLPDTRFPGATGGLQATSALPPAAEQDIHDKPISESADTAPGGAPGPREAATDHSPLATASSKPLSANDWYKISRSLYPVFWFLLATCIAAEQNIHAQPNSESAETGPGGAAVPAPPAAAEQSIHAQPISESADTALGGPAGPPWRSCRRADGEFRSRTHCVRTEAMGIGFPRSGEPAGNPESS